MAATGVIAPVDAARILGAMDNNAGWLTHGRTWAEERYSPLDRINRDNVGRLALAWHYELDTNRGQQATPLVIDGVIYLTTAWSKALALQRAEPRCAPGRPPYG